MYLFLHPVITADEYAVCKSQGKEPRSWVFGVFKVEVCGVYGFVMVFVVGK